MVSWVSPLSAGAEEINARTPREKEGAKKTPYIFIRKGGEGNEGRGWGEEGRNHKVHKELKGRKEYYQFFFKHRSWAMPARRIGKKVLSGRPEEREKISLRSLCPLCSLWFSYAPYP